LRQLRNQPGKVIEHPFVGGRKPPRGAERLRNFKRAGKMIAPLLWAILARRLSRLAKADPGNAS
jgi:hypothetical protein